VSPSYPAGRGDRRTLVTPAPSFGAVLGRIGETQPPLPAAAAVLIGLIALVVVVVHEIWLLAQHLDTIAHEGAHALVGSALGRTVRAVRFKPNGDGGTLVSGGRIPGDVAIGFVGYLGPSAFGLGAAKLIELQHSVAVLWLALVLLVVLLPVLREWFSFVPVLISGALIFIIARYASVGGEDMASYGLAWFLLLSGLRAVIDHGVRAGDAGRLAGLTRIWPAAWVALWLAGTVTALAVGGSLLV
jgi:Peptidase M50B-like